METVYIVAIAAGALALILIVYFVRGRLKNVSVDLKEKRFSMEAQQEAQANPIAAGVRVTDNELRKSTVDAPADVNLELQRNRLDTSKIRIR
jgi:hypothetical protein